MNARELIESSELAALQAVELALYEQPETRKVVITAIKSAGEHWKKEYLPGFTPNAEEILERPLDPLPPRG